MGADLQEELSEIKALEESEKIADKVCKKLMSMQKIPDFPTGSVPIADAAKIYGRDQDWVRAGIVQGMVADWNRHKSRGEDYKIITNEQCVWKNQLLHIS